MLSNYTFIDSYFDFVFVYKMEMMNFSLSGWTQAYTASGHGASSSVYDMEQGPSTAYSPRYLYKRRRLSMLLDKLAVQISNNNQYATPPWLAVDAPYFDRPLTPDDEPLDLSIKSESHPPGPAAPAPAPTHKREREPEPEPEPEPVFVCTVCGQTFGVQDRLAKHVASRHRNRTPDAAKAYECEVCMRRFARSDMLTRHARLHSGVKPYSCPQCGQVFSRSDHLATHQRTHTGEKPYRCPACPYAACRRDMITRHMRTHTRHEQQLLLL